MNPLPQQHNRVAACRAELERKLVQVKRLADDGHGEDVSSIDRAAGQLERTIAALANLPG